MKYKNKIIRNIIFDSKQFTFKVSKEQFGIL